MSACSVPPTATSALSITAVLPASPSTTSTPAAYALPALLTVPAALPSTPAQLVCLATPLGQTGNASPASRTASSARLPPPARFAQVGTTSTPHQFARLAWLPAASAMGRVPTVLPARRILFSTKANA